MQSQSSRQSGIIINDSSVWEAAPETIPRTGGSQSSTRFHLGDDPRADQSARGHVHCVGSDLDRGGGGEKERRKKGGEGRAGLINISNTGGGRN